MTLGKHCVSKISNEQNGVTTYGDKAGFMNSQLTQKRSTLVQLYEVCICNFYHVVPQYKLI